MTKQKIIEVVDKDGEPLSPTELRIANTLVKRKKAIWIRKGAIKMISTKKDLKKLKNIVIKEEKRICYLCGEYIPKNEPATIDHVYPMSKHGRDVRENLHCCCKRCNEEKGQLTLYEFFLKVKQSKSEGNNDFDYLDLKKIKKTVEEYISIRY